MISQQVHKKLLLNRNTYIYINKREILPHLYNQRTNLITSAETHSEKNCQSFNWSGTIFFRRDKWKQF